MLDKTTHPFIVNTLESSPAWSLQTRKYPDAWEVEMWFYEDEGFQVAMSRAEGLTLTDALDNLERLLETGSTKP
jgi:hypothetical protein